MHWMNLKNKNSYKCDWSDYEESTLLSFLFYELTPSVFVCKFPLLFSHFLKKVVSVIMCVLILSNCFLFVCVLNLTFFISK